MLAAFGKAFNDARYVSVVYIVLPVIGILERHGLQERARSAIAALRGATVGRLLIGYLLLRQFTAALGLTSIAGPAQTVRPLVAPMAQAAAKRQGADPDSDRIPAMAAATDTVGLFFGEDIFIAIGSILLMVGVLHGFGIEAEPLQLAKWAIRTALCAFAIHASRLWLLDRQLARQRSAANDRPQPRLRGRRRGLPRLRCDFGGRPGQPAALGQRGVLRAADDDDWALSRSMRSAWRASRW